MDEREKIKAALEQGSKAFSAYFRSELRKALDGGKGHFGTRDTEKTVIGFIADALIAAGIRDITREGYICMNGEVIVPTPDIYNKVAELLDCPKIKEREIEEEERR